MEGAVLSAEPEKVVAMYDLPDATVRLGFLSRVPLFLAVYDSGRVAVVFQAEGVTVELASTH